MNHCRNHFVGHRLGASFVDVQQIEFSNINYKKIEARMTMSAEFSKRLNRICSAQNETEIMEILADSNIEAENRELKETIKELLKRIEDLQKQLENEREKQKEQNIRSINNSESKNSDNKLKRKAEESGTRMEKESKRRRVE